MTATATCGGRVGADHFPTDNTMSNEDKGIELARKICRSVFETSDHDETLLISVIKDEPSVLLDTSNTPTNATLLHIAAENAKERLIRLLVNYDPVRDNINVKDKDGRTALHLVSKKETDNVNCAKLLTSNGAVVDALDNEGWTPLFFACFYGRPKIAEYFAFECGANVNIECKWLGKPFTPLSIARQRKQNLVVAALTKQPVMEERPRSGSFDATNNNNAQQQGTQLNTKRNSRSLTRQDSLLLKLRLHMEAEQTPGASSSSSSTTTSGSPTVSPNTSSSNLLNLSGSNLSPQPETVESLKMQLQTQTTVLQGLTLAHNQFKDKCEDLSKQNASLHNEIDSLTRSLEEQKSTVNQLKAEIATLNEIRKKSQLINGVDQNYDKISLDQLRSWREEYKSDIAKLKAAIEKKIDRLQEERICVICCLKERNTLLLPCYHLAVCDGCSTGLKECLLCKSKIESSKKIFL